MYSKRMDDWRERAGCRGMTTIFYSDQHRKCRFICDGCPVFEQCIATSADDEPDPFQLWGFRHGMTASERYRWRMMKSRLDSV